jgi:hypothetical protein
MTRYVAVLPVATLVNVTLEQLAIPAEEDLEAKANSGFR